MVPTVDSRRRQGLPPFIYWPMTGPFLLVVIVVAVALVALLQVGLVTYALGRLGVSPEAAAIVLLACLLGGAVNIPVARLRGRAEVQLQPVISVFGMRYFVPVLRSRVTVIAVNLGGALIPAALSVYLIVHDHLGWWALLAVAIVGAGVHIVARPVPGLGIAVPTLLPALFAVLAAVLVHAMHPAVTAALAYVGGTLGTLAGADLANLGKIRRLGAPVASIGGAGTFDGVFLTGIIAVLLASFL